MNEIARAMPQYQRKEVANIMMRKHRFTLAAALALAAGMLALGGCMNTDDRAQPTEAPTAQATAQPLTNGAGAVGANPAASASPNIGAAQTSGARPAYDWANNAANAANEINRISEIDKSYVVVDGDDAVVGLTFDASYRGGLTERIASMVRQKLVTLDPALEDIEVTAEPELVKLIQALADKLASGATIEQLEDEFEGIYDQIKAARKAAR